MNSVHFIYGNQSLELEEVSAAVINDLLEGIDRENGLVTYDVEDLLSSEPGKEKKLISEFQNTCDTVSFFASKIIVHIKNLQKIPGKKSPTTLNLISTSPVDKLFKKFCTWGKNRSIWN